MKCSWSSRSLLSRRSGVNNNIVDINNEDINKEKRMSHLESLYCAFAANARDSNTRFFFLRVLPRVKENFLETYLFCPNFPNCFRPRPPTTLPETDAEARWSGNIPALSSTGSRVRESIELGTRERTRGHVREIFPFGDVEIRVNRFFDRNSGSIGIARVPSSLMFVPNCFKSDAELG